MRGVHGRRFFRIALIVATFSASGSLVGQQAVDRSGTSSKRFDLARDLQAGASAQVDLARGQAKALGVTLQSGQFLHLDVIPRGIAIAIDCLDPSRRKFRELTSPYPSEGPLFVFLVAPRTGRYIFSVRAIQTGGVAGSITVKTASIRPATPDDRVRSEAQARLAEGIRLRDQGTGTALKSAVDEYERSLELWQSISEGQPIADTQVAMALAFYDQGENQKAREVALRALSLFQAVGDRRGEAAALDLAGEAEDAMGDEQRALTHYEVALTLRKALGDRLAEAETLNNIGVVYDSLGEKRRALEYFEQSLALKHILKLPDREGTTLNNVGSVLFALGDMQGALARYRQALPLRHAQGDINGESVTLTNIGSVYLTLGDSKTAMAYYRQALRLADRAGNSVWRGTLRNNIGLATFQRGDAPNALANYQQSLEFKHAAGDKAGEAITLNNLAKAFGQTGDVVQEQDHFARALDLIRGVGDKRWEANILNNIGNAYIGQVESAQASAYFSDALRLAQTIGDSRAESVARFGLARIAAARGDHREARKTIEEVLPIVESLRAKVASVNLRASYFATLREPYDFYVDLLMQMHHQDASQGYDAQALAILERARARTLLETLGESRAALRAGVDPSLLDRERSLRERIEGKRDVQIAILSRVHTETEALAIRSDLNDLLTQYREIEGEIRSKSPRYASLTQPNALSAAEIQELLDDETLIIEFFVGDQRSFAWAITRQAMTTCTLPTQSVINAAVRRLYDLLTERSRVEPKETLFQQRRRVERAEREYPKAAAAVSQMVLGPFAGLLAQKRLVIVSDGALHYIPFAALPAPRVDDRAKPVDASVGQAQNVPLIVDHEIVRLPSASVLAVLRRQAAGRVAASKKVMVLADPVYGPDDPRVTNGSIQQRGPRGETTSQSPASDRARERLLRSAEDIGIEGVAFRRLSFANREARAILKLAPPGMARAALDFEASRTTAMSPVLRQYGILHFATHGVLNNERPDLSGLVLSLVDRRGRPQNGFLQLEDVYNLELNADLVVLGACQTGIGKEIKGEGLIALARGFMHAGAARVVASLWKVDDAATTELMQSFYSEMLERGKSAAAALREAQLAILRQPARSAPFFWSGFEIQGEWR